MFYKKSITKIFTGLFAALLIFGSANLLQAKATSTPEESAVQFYKWYLTALNQNKDPRSKQKQKLLSYLSKRFGKWVYSIRDYDADVFIDAQDFDDDWAQAISTSNAVVKGDVATLKVTLGVTPGGKVIKSNWKQELRLKMVKEGGLWKIDRVNDSH